MEKILTKRDGYVTNERGWGGDIKSTYDVGIWWTDIC